MNIDELASAIEAVSQEENVRGLVAVLKNWKKDDSSTAEELITLVERYIGNVGFETACAHEAICSLWSQFRDESISCIRGMTINERLYAFGLFERFDNAGQIEQSAIYAKLHACP